MILNYAEAGIDQALLGMALSYYDHATPLHDWWDEDRKAKAYKRAKLLAFKQGGHNKFLESIQVWMTIQASRDFWSEFDTYRVGMTKQSASTMHTLTKRKATSADFAEGTTQVAIDNLNQLIEDKADISTIKKNLPEGWLQERMVCTNYKMLQNIYAQRHNHRLQQWRTFCEALVHHLHYPAFVIPEIDLGRITQTDIKHS